MSRAASTASRSSLGWQIPADEWDAFVSSVGAEWSDDAETVRYELERAMINFIDTDDDLVAAEKLLRDARDVRELSSSTADALTRDVDREQKQLIGVRVRDDVQDSFRAYVSKAFNDGMVARYSNINGSHTTYADALTAALSEYRDGGTGRRIRALAEEVITGESDRSRNSIFVESDEDDTSDLSTAPAVSTTPSSRIILEVADQLPSSFPASLLIDEIEQHAGNEHDRLTDELVDKYREAILDELPVVEHPDKNGLYITEEDREDITTWSDLDKQGRVRHLCEYLIIEADESGSRRKRVTYTDVKSLFDEYLNHKPSDQYAYDAMEAAASVDGFYYTTTHGDKQLRLDRQRIPEDLRADVIIKHNVTPIRKSAKEAETAESGDMDAREADSNPCDPPIQAGKTGTDEPNNWDDVVEAVSDLPLDEMDDEQVTKILRNNISQHNYAQPADFDDGSFVVDDSRYDELRAKVTEDDLTAVRNRLDVNTSTNTATDDDGNEAVEDTLDALDQATPEAMTDGGSNTDITGD
jgi:hypothetical protein